MFHAASACACLDACSRCRHGNAVSTHCTQCHLFLCASERNRLPHHHHHHHHHHPPTHPLATTTTTHSPLEIIASATAPKPSSGACPVSTSGLTAAAPRLPRPAPAPASAPVVEVAAVGALVMVSINVVFVVVVLAADVGAAYASGNAASVHANRNGSRGAIFFGCGLSLAARLVGLFGRDCLRFMFASARVPALRASASVTPVVCCTLVLASSRDCARVFDQLRELVRRRG